MIRKYLTFLVFTFSSYVIFSGYATAASPQKIEDSSYAANFNYKPDFQAAPGSAEVTFAVANVGYEYQTDSKIFWYKSPLLVNLSDAIKRDLSAILRAKGFSVRGPFDSYDLIPYPDKKVSDLYVISKMELLFTSKGPKGLPKDVMGNMEVTGKITIELKEIVTRELMWTKSIPLAKFEFPYKGKIVWGAGVTVDDVKNAGIEKPVEWLDLGLINDVAKGIEKQYPDLMATIAKFIDPEEMRIIKKQAQELKDKSDIERGITSLKSQH